MKTDKPFCDLMLSSSCFGKEVCPTPPCACAQSLIDRVVADTFERLQDHYWDSLAPHKALILKHVRGALVAEVVEPYADIRPCMDCGEPFEYVPNSGDRSRCKKCRAQYG